MTEKLVLKLCTDLYFCTFAIFKIKVSISVTNLYTNYIGRDSRYSQTKNWNMVAFAFGISKD